MEKLIKVKQEYGSLEKVMEFIGTQSPFEASIDYDHWEIRTDENGQMKQCVVVKKSKMHGAKAYFVDENTLKVNYVIPNKAMNAYFGKSQKARRNIFEIITGKIKGAALAGSQKKAFGEIVQSLNKIS